MEIGDIISKRRKEKNLTQSQLASLLNVSSKTISKWETNRGLPEVSIIPVLAKSLEISTDELFGNTETKLSFVVNPKLIYNQKNANLISAILILIGCAFLLMGFNLLNQEANLFILFIILGPLFMIFGITFFYYLRNRYTERFINEYQFLSIDRSNFKKIVSIWYFEFLLSILFSYFIWVNNPNYMSDNLNFIILHSILAIILSILYLIIRQKNQ